MEINMACNAHNLFFSEEDNSADVNKYYLNQTSEEDKNVTEDYHVTFLSRQIPPKSRVLDVGCAQGKFGRILAEKDCVLYGVDVNRASIKFVNSQGYYQSAFICDVTCPDSEEFKQLTSTGKFDVIILSDILEHLADPTAVLLNLYSLLSANGFFLVSVPNVANIDICLNLLEGRFNYGLLGILDNTHLKFFTKSSFFEWIDLINTKHPEQKLYCSYLGESYYESDYVCEIEKEYPKLFHIVSSRPDYSAFQIFFRLDQNQMIQINGLGDKRYGKNSVVSNLGDALEGKSFLETPVPLIQSEREALIKEIRGMQTYINHLEAQNSAMEAQWKKDVEQWQKDSVQWRRDVEQWQKDSVQWRRDVEQWQKDSAQWGRDVEQWQKDLVQWEKDVKQLQRDAGQWKAAYEEISNAFFWKITKPLRVIFDTVKRLSHLNKNDL